MATDQPKDLIAAHGASSYNNYGCRCETCTRGHAEDDRRKREDRSIKRVLIDGRLIAPLPDERHGKLKTYQNHGCRCVRCTVAGTKRTGEQRRKNFSKRVLVDGRLIAPLPDEQHGKLGTYTNHGCRCEPCRNAKSRDTIKSGQPKKR